MDNYAALNENGTAPVVPTPVKKHCFELDGLDRGFALAMVVLCVAFISHGLFRGLFFGFSLIFTLIFIVVSIYLTKNGTKPGAFACVCGGLALCGGAAYTVCTNFAVKFFLIPMLFVLCVIWFSALAGVKIPDGDLGVISLILKNGVADSFVKVPAAIGSIASGKEGSKRKGIKAFIGILCALPVACIVVFLLANADFAFDHMVSGVMEKTGEYIGYLIGGLILSVFVIAFSFSLKKEPCGKEKASDLSKIDGIYVASFLGLLSLCYMAFLLSQLNYFFDAFKNTLPEGYSFAEYARGGFFELCAVSLINLAVIFGALVLSVKKEGRLSGAVKALSLFVSLFTLLLSAISGAKMLMYIKNYGLTVLRVGTSAVIIFIAVVFVSLIIRLFSRKAKVLHTAVITASVLLVILGLANIDKIICEYNYNAYVSGLTQEIDLWTIRDSGASGVPYLEKLTNDKNYIVASCAAWHLNDGCYEYYDLDDEGNIVPIEKNRTYKGIASFNLCNKKAWEVLESFDFGKYDFKKIEKYFGDTIYRYYDYDYDFVEDETTAAYEQMDEAEKTKSFFEPENFYEVEYCFDKIAEAVRRAVETGKVDIGDELEYYGGNAADASLNIVNDDDSLTPLFIYGAEQDALIKAAEAAPQMYKIKVFKNCLHFCCDDDCGISDRLVYSYNEFTPSTTVEEDGKVNIYSAEYLDSCWYRLIYISTEE